MDSVLSTQFENATDASGRVAKAIGMLDQDQFMLEVYQSRSGSQLYFQITEPGCGFFWPRVPDSNVLVWFNENKNYAGFQRWPINEGPFTERASTGHALMISLDGNVVQFDRLGGGLRLIEREE